MEPSTPSLVDPPQTPGTQPQGVTGQPNSEGSLRRAKSIQEVTELETKVQNVYHKSLKPLADRFAFRLGTAKNTPTGLPTVLLMGNHSSGKSTFINHLFGRDIQKTGVAPVDDGFTLIMHGETETDFDGKAVVTHPQLPYQSLEQFGPTFLSHLKLKVRASEVVRSLVLIDSPGMIDSAKNARTRGYDFTGAVRHFAENADLIVFFFDPDKPGTTGESLTVFTDALSNVAHKLLIVMNKVDLFPNVRDFARAYGALCWNLAHVIKTKDLPHIFCTYIDAGTGPRSSQLPLGDFRESRNEVIAEIERTPERRSDNLVNTLYDTARTLQMHARVSSRLSCRFACMRSSTRAMAFLAGLLGAAGTWMLYSKNPVLDFRHLLPFAAGLLVAALIVFVRTLIGKVQLANNVTHLDEVFHTEYQRELTMQSDKADLEALWERVKPRVVEYVQQTDVKNIPRKGFKTRSVFEKVSIALNQEIPALRRDIVRNAEKKA